MGRAAKLIAARRQFILQFLVRLGGRENERVIVRAARAGGFYGVSEAEIAGDIDTLIGERCVAAENLDGLRIVAATTRGEDAAYGRGAPIPGIAHDLWRR